MNINIKQAKRKFEMVLIALIIFQIIFLFITNIFFNKFSSELGDNDIDYQIIKKVFIYSEIIIFIVIDILFGVKFIYRLQTMLHIEPKRCIIEDFIIYPYGTEDYSGNMRQKDYRISPVVKDLENNELYFTFGNYSLSYYSSIETRMNKKVLSKIIFRKDGSKVEIGDKAFFYIRKKVHVDVNIDESNNVITLNNKKMFFLHANEDYDINMFNKITFFEGIVEVEDIGED